MQPFGIGEDVIVEDIIYCSTSQSLILASSKKELQVWKKNTISNQYEQSSPLEGHESMVTALRICQETNTLFSASRDKNLIIWKLKEKEGVLNYRMHQILGTESTGIDCLAYSQKNRIIFAGTRDSKIFVFQRNEETLEFEQKQVIIGTFEIVKSRTGKNIQEFEDIKYNVKSMNFNDKYDILYVAAQEKKLFIYGSEDVDGDGERKYVFKNKINLTLKNCSVIDLVTHIPKYNIIVSGSEGNQVVLWKRKNDGGGVFLNNYGDNSEDLEMPEYEYFTHFKDHLQYIQCLVYSERLGNVVITGGDDGFLNWYSIQGDKENEEEMEEDGEDNFDDDMSESCYSDSMQMPIDQGSQNLEAVHGGKVDRFQHRRNVVAMYYCEISNQLFSASDSSSVRVRMFEEDGFVVEKSSNPEKIGYDDYVDPAVVEAERLRIEEEQRMQEEEAERLRVEEEQRKEEAERNKINEILENQKKEEHKKELQRLEEEEIIRQVQEEALLEESKKKDEKIKNLEGRFISNFRHLEETH